MLANIHVNHDWVILCFLPCIFTGAAKSFGLTVILEEFVHFVLQAAGVEFPPRTENTVPLFTPPQTHPVAYQPATSAYEDAALEASLQSDVSALRLLLQIFLLCKY